MMDKPWKPKLCPERRKENDDGRRKIMKLWQTLSALLVILTSPGLAAGIYPQFGLEFTLGANNLLLVSPWAGLRFPLSDNASFLLKYYGHSLKYTYTGFDEATEQFVERTRKANLSNFTTGVYYQKNKWTAWGAASFMVGTDRYKALVLDAGVGREIWEWLTLEGGLYLLREDSILWYPEEERRMINIASLKAGLKIKLIEGIFFNSIANVYWTSEDVKAQSYYLGLILSSAGSLYMTLYYSRYSESSTFKFSGNYISVGLNFYY